MEETQHAQLVAIQINDFDLECEGDASGGLDNIFNHSHGDCRGKWSVILNRLASAMAVDLVETLLRTVQHLIRSQELAKLVMNVASCSRASEGRRARTQSAQTPSPSKYREGNQNMNKKFSSLPDVFRTIPDIEC